MLKLIKNNDVRKRTWIKVFTVWNNKKEHIITYFKDVLEKHLKNAIAWMEEHGKTSE